MNFDKIIDRTNTNCLKYDFAVERGYPQGIQPFWVADMDFQAPEGVIQELISRSGHGIFGYTDPDQRYTDTLKKWFKTHHNWDVEGNELTITPGVVFALAAAIFLRLFLRRDLNLSIANHNRFYLVILKHLIKLAVRHLVRAAALPEVVHHRHAEKRKQHRHDQDCIILTAGIFSIFILVSLIIHTLSPFCVTVHPESATSGFSKAPLNLPHLLLIRLHARFSSPSVRKFLRTLFHYSGRLPINQEVKILKTCELLIK